MKWLLSLPVAGGLLLTLFAFATQKRAKSDFEASREVIVMRKIAHQVLRYTGDSTSVILPVKAVSTTEYQIPFGSNFSFKTDSLVRIIDQIISTSGLPSSYIVNVVDFSTDQVVFGYAVLQQEHWSIVPCLGRNGPAKRYRIDIKFAEEESESGYLYLAGFGLIGLGLTLTGVQRFRKAAPPANMPLPDGTAAAPNETGSCTIGQYVFYPERQLLVLGGKEQVLTQKEARILRIFAAEPNVLIDRNRLQKEVWEDEGVIVGRSLDMYISKLRKKLEDDPTVKLANVHGRGYKLEIALT